MSSLQARFRLYSTGVVDSTLSGGKTISLLGGALLAGGNGVCGNGFGPAVGAVVPMGGVGAPVTVGTPVLTGAGPGVPGGTGGCTVGILPAILDCCMVANGLPPRCGGRRGDPCDVGGIWFQGCC